MIAKITSCALLMLLLSGIATSAAARSVGYSNNGDCVGDNCPPIGESAWGQCDNLGGTGNFVNVQSDVCAGIFPGNVTHVGKLDWCTYALDEPNPFFKLTDVIAGRGTLTFRRPLRGPVELQFNGVVPGPLEILFNVSFGFDDGFDRDTQVVFDFVSPDATLWSGTVRTIAIHMGDFDFPSGPAFVTHDAAAIGTPMSPVQAHKCQDPGTARY